MEVKLKKIETIDKSIEGKTFENYKKMCEYLKVPMKGGSAKVSQMKEIRSLAEIVNDGHEIKFVRIYDKPLVIRDRRNENKIGSHFGDFENLENKIFGKLKIVSFYERIRNKRYKLDIYWLAHCECGNDRIVSRSELFHANVNCCTQCLENKKDSKIALELKKYYKKFNSAIVEYKILVNTDTGRFLPFDIYLPNENIYIEIQGEQHYKFISTFHVTVDSFEYSQYKDKLKKEFAEENGTFIEIDLRKIKNSVDAIILINETIEDVK